MADDNTSSSKDIISRLKQDNVTAQRTLCGKCGLPMAQSKDGISDKNLVPVKGKITSKDKKPARGFMCGTCLENPQFKEEGPRNAVIIDERTGDIRPVFYDNLLDSPSTTTAAAKERGEEEKESAQTSKSKRGR